MRDDLHDAPADDAPWIADAAFVVPLEVPERPRARCPDARRALFCAILGVVCFGFIFGPLALAMGNRARFAIAAQPGLGGAGAARAAITLGRVGLALHLTILMTALPWLLFALPLVGGFGG